MSRRVVGAVLAIVVAGVLFIPGVATASDWADPTPSPTVGSTESPNPQPGDDNDANPEDASQPWLVLLVPLGIVLLGFAAGLVVFRSRRSSQAEAPGALHEEAPDDHRST